MLSIFMGTYPLLPEQIFYWLKIPLGRYFLFSQNYSDFVEKCELNVLKLCFCLIFRSIKIYEKQISTSLCRLQNLSTKKWKGCRILT